MVGHIRTGGLGVVMQHLVEQVWIDYYHLATRYYRTQAWFIHRKVRKLQKHNAELRARLIELGKYDAL